MPRQYHGRHIVATTATGRQAKLAPGPDGVIVQYDSAMEARYVPMIDPECRWERQVSVELAGVVFKIDFAIDTPGGLRYVEVKAFHVKPGKRKPWLYRPVDPTWNLIKKLWLLHGPAPLDVWTWYLSVCHSVETIIPVASKTNTGALPDGAEGS